MSLASDFQELFNKQGFPYEVLDQNILVLKVVMYHYFVFFMIQKSHESLQKCYSQMFSKHLVDLQYLVLPLVPIKSRLF